MKYPEVTDTADRSHGILLDISSWLWPHTMACHAVIRSEYIVVPKIHLNSNVAAPIGMHYYRFDSC